MGAKRYASNAERQRAYRERKRNGDGVTEANPLEALHAEWRRAYFSNVVNLLTQVAALGGAEAGRLAAEAIELALADERAWAAVGDLDRTTQGYNLKRLVKRKDPRVQQFLEDCKYLA